MDVNGTRFQLIQGNADWAACLEDGESGPWVNAYWDATCHCVTLAPLLTIVPPPRTGSALDPARRRGAAADRFGHWYWIGNDAQSIHWLPRGTQTVRLLWPQAARAPSRLPGSFQTVDPSLPATLELAGLTTTRHHYLVAGCTQPAGLLIFDLESGARPSLLTLPKEVPFTPFDLAPAPDGGLWVLDRVHRTYWGFDRDFRALAGAPAVAPPPSAFHPIDEAATPAPVPPMPAGFPIAAPDPIAIEDLPDGTVLILDGSAAEAPPGTAASSIYRYRLGAQVGTPLLLAGVVKTLVPPASALQTTTLQVVAHDIAYNADSRTLYAADHFGRQSLAFALTLEPTAALAIQNTYLPMHLFGGRGLVAWRDQGAATVSYDVVGGAASSDAAVRWARLQAIDRADYAVDAVLVTPVLDGKARDCVWDGLFLDACIPPGSSVSVFTCTDNDPSLIADPQAPFNAEPDLHLRRAGVDSEIPFYDAFADRTPQPDRLGTWELLMQQAQGRYLKIKLEISGNGRVTPQLKALRAYYPRFSYPRQYLPAVYLEDPVSASFLERLLANPKGFYSDIEAKIRNVGCLFDPRNAPTEALDWLASWLGLTLDPLWQNINQRLQTSSGSTTQAGRRATAQGTSSSTARATPDRRRLFIRFATRLFTRRGTADGIRFALYLLLDPGLERTLLRFQRAALAPDPVLNAQLTGLGLPVPTPYMSAGDIEDLFVQYLLSPQRPSKIRLVERFMTRGNLAVAAGDPTEGGDTDNSVSATAHRFAILIPETLPADVQTMVSRIVDLEKPAHTDYEVRRYWDYFRVGEARLGIDTALGEDSRFVRIVLGQNALAEGYLNYPPPMDARDRPVLDRDPIGAMPAL